MVGVTQFHTWASMAKMARLREDFRRKGARETRWRARDPTRGLPAVLADYRQRFEDRRKSELAENDNHNAASHTSTEPTIVSSKFNRRLLLSTDQPFDVKVMMILNRVYYVESKMLEAFQDLAIGRILAEADPGNEATLELWAEPQVFSAWCKETRRRIDRWTDANELTAHVADIPAPGGRSIEVDFAELLQDFFVMCQVPNMAEINMLSDVCDETVPWMLQWFIERRTQTVWLEEYEHGPWV